MPCPVKVLAASSSALPRTDSDSTSVSYPVTVRLTDVELADVLPGMNAVATLASNTVIGPDSWLVPTNGLVKRVTPPLSLWYAALKRWSSWLSRVPSKANGPLSNQRSYRMAIVKAVGSVTTDTDSDSGFGGGPSGGTPVTGGPPQ